MLLAVDEHSTHAICVVMDASMLAVMLATMISCWECSPLVSCVVHHVLLLGTSIRRLGVLMAAVTYTLSAQLLAGGHHHG